MEKQYDPTGLEAKWYPRWEGAGLFTPPADLGGDPFVITLPPPNVTGILHIGHCLGAGIMDALVRYYRMHGRPTLFVPGTDHAGDGAAQLGSRAGAVRGAGTSDGGGEQAGGDAGALLPGRAARRDGGGSRRSADSSQAFSPASGALILAGAVPRRRPNLPRVGRSSETACAVSS